MGVGKEKEVMLIEKCLKNNMDGVQVQKTGLVHRALK
jgi:hypothetical protein